MGSGINVGVATPLEKKSENLGLKVQSSVLQTIATIAEKEDPTIKSVRIEFSCNGEKPFEESEIIATQVDKIR